MNKLPVHKKILAAFFAIDDGFKTERNTLKKSIVNLQHHGSLADLLGYCVLINEGTILMKDGGLTACFEYMPKDVDSSTGTMLDGDAYAVQLALNSLPNGWLVQWDLISQEENKYHDIVEFDNVASALVDDARRFNFERGDSVFSSRYVISLVYKPSDKASKSLAAWFSQTDKDHKISPIEKELEYFNDVLSIFFAQFSKITATTATAIDGKKESRLTRLQSDELITFLKLTLTADKTRLSTPKVGFFLDYYLADRHFIAGLMPQIGDKYIKVLAIDDLPEHTYPAILDELNYIGCEYRWSSKYIALSPKTATSELKKIKRGWSSQAIGAIGVIKAAAGMNVQLDEAAEIKKQQTQAAIVENDNGTVRYGFYTSVIVLTDEDKARVIEKAKIIAQLITELNFKCRDETVNATEAFLGSLPGHGQYNIRKPLVDTEYISHSTPTSGVWSGNRHFVHPRMKGYKPAFIYAKTRNNRTFRLNICASDVMNTLIVGPTGSGKSTLVGLMGMQWQKYNNAKIKVFDKDHSNSGWVLASHGTVFDMAATQYAPLADLLATEENTVDFNRELSWVTAWIKNILYEKKVTVDAFAEKSITEEVLNKYRSHKALGLSLSIEDFDFQDETIKQAWKNFIAESNGLLSGTIDHFALNTIVSMGIDEIIKKAKVVVIAVIELIFQKLMKEFAKAEFTLFILEEFWLYLSYPLFLSKIKDWLKTLRKFNVAVIAVTQNLDDIFTTSLASELMQSCPTKIFLPNEHLAQDKIKYMYKDFGLNDQQLEIIRSAVPKREYYVSSLEGNRLIDFELSPLELAFIGIGGEDLPMFKKYYDPNNKHWILDYLSSKNLNDWSDYAKEAYL